MLAVARGKLKRTEIIEADITTDDVLQERKFNLITAFRFFVNAEPSLRCSAMQALAGLLSEDGYFVFNNHQSYGSPWIRLRWLRHRQLEYRASSIGHRAGVFNVMTIGQMRKLVENAGLEIVELYPVGFFHPPKISVPVAVCSAVENVCSCFKGLARFSECPVAVCCRRGKLADSGQKTERCTLYAKR